MWRSRSYDRLGAGAISKNWWVRAATVLFVTIVGAVLGFVFGSLLVGLIWGVVLGVGCVVMGEASMDTGAYKYPEKYF